MCHKRRTFLRRLRLASDSRIPGTGHANRLEKVLTRIPAVQNGSHPTHRRKHISLFLCCKEGWGSRFPTLKNARGPWFSRAGWLALSCWFARKSRLAHLSWISLYPRLALFTWVSPRQWLARAIWFTQRAWLAQHGWFSQRPEQKASIALFPFFPTLPSASRDRRSREQRRSGSSRLGDSGGRSYALEANSPDPWIAGPRRALAVNLVP